jgi:rhodanese-related sulfurtransferase
VIALGITLCGCKSTEPTEIRAKDVKGFMDFEALMLILDVREPNEYCSETGHLPGARNYPWVSGVLQQRFRELPPQAPIIVVCRSGRRSRQATTFLRERGYSRALNMAGGMNDWEWETEACPDSNDTAENAS